MPNVHELIRDLVTLSIRCLDRLYLHAYMPKLQTSGGSVLLPPGSPGPSDPLAGVVRAYAGPLRRRHQDLHDYVGRAVDYLRARSAQRRRGRSASRAAADGRRRGGHRRGARKDAGIQSAQAIGALRRGHLRRRGCKRSAISSGPPTGAIARA
jgi:hypothetical protein